MAYGVNPITGRPGPAPLPARDGDRKQARQSVNIEVQKGRLPHPNTLPCSDCGHLWAVGSSRHEYDHYLGYGPEHHLHVEPVCKACHVKRDNVKAKQTHCIHGHEFNTANTIFKPNGTRACRECRRAHDRNRGRDAAFWRQYREDKKRHG